MPVCHSDVCVFGMLVWISPSKLHKCCKPAKCMISLLTQRKNTLSIEGLTCTWCNKKKQMEVCEEQPSLGAEGKMLEHSVSVSTHAGTHVTWLPVRKDFTHRPVFFVQSAQGLESRLCCLQCCVCQRLFCVGGGCGPGQQCGRWLGVERSLLIGSVPISWQRVDHWATKFRPPWSVAPFLFFLFFSQTAGWGLVGDWWGLVGDCVFWRVLTGNR